MSFWGDPPPPSTVHRPIAGVLLFVPARPFPAQPAPPNLLRSLKRPGRPSTHCLSHTLLLLLGSGSGPLVSSGYLHTPCVSARTPYLTQSPCSVTAPQALLFHPGSASLPRTVLSAPTCCGSCDGGAHLGDGPAWECPLSPCRVATQPCH